MAKGAITVKIDGQYDDKDINKAIKDLNALKSQADGTNGPMGSLTGTMKNLAIAAGGLYAIKQVTGFLTDSVAAAAADEAELARLNQTLDNLGFGDKAAELQTWVDQLQFSANVSEGELRPALQSLLVATKDITRAQQLMGLALDLSASGFGTTEQAANALAKAVSTGSVSRLNAFTKGGLDPAIIKSKDLDGALQQLSATFGGAAATRSATLQSKLEGLKLAAGELQESFGQGIIDGFIESLSGGTDSIDEAEQSMRDMQAAAADLGEAIGQLGAWALQGFEVIRGTVVGVVYNLVQAVNGLYNTYIDVADALAIMSDAEADAERARQVAIMSAQKQAYQEDLLGYKFGESATAATTAATAATGYAGAVDTTTAASEDATVATDGLAEAIKKVDARWATKEERFQFLDYLDTVKTKFDKTSKSIGDNSVAGRENQRVLMEGYDLAISGVQKWAQQTGASQEEILTKQDTNIRKLRRQWIDSGISKSDVDKWLAVNTGWTPSQKTLIKNAKDAGIDIGEALMNGTIQGLRNRVGAAEAMATTAVNKMTAAANAAGLIQSPSKVWYVIGENLGKGLENGLAVSWPKLAAQVTKGIEGLSLTLGKGTADIPAAMAKEFDARAQAFGAVIKNQSEKIVEARRALDDYAKSVTSTVMGNISFSDTAANGDPLTPEQIVQAVLGDITNQMSAVQAISQIATKIPAALAQQMLTMDPAAAIALADYLAANPAQAAQLQTNYNNLATYTQTALGVPMANAFAMVGDESATKMIARAKRKIAEASDDFKKWVREHLDTTLTVKVKYDTSDAPGRAAGGPVTGSSPYIVGENGPELFVPWTNGDIVANGDLPTASGSYGRGASSGGNTYTINVSAGVGDPRQIGQSVVEYIRKFEKANGPVFAAAV